MFPHLYFLGFPKNTMLISRKQRILVLMHACRKCHAHVACFQVMEDISVKHLLSEPVLLLKVTFVPSMLLFLFSGWEYWEVYAKLMALAEGLSSSGTWKTCELSTVTIVFCHIIMRLEHGLVKMSYFSPDVVLPLIHFIIETLPSVFPDGNLSSVVIILFDLMA